MHLTVAGLAFRCSHQACRSRRPLGGGLIGRGSRICKGLHEIGLLAGCLRLDPMNGQEGAADALEDSRFPRHQGECDGFGDALIRGRVPAHEKLAQSEREDIEQPLRRDAGFGEVAIAIGERVGGVEALAFGEPLEIAALAPEGEVDLGNARAIELRTENGLHFRQGVEPYDEFPASFAFEKTKIELFPDVVREIGDFPLRAGIVVILEV